MSMFYLVLLYGATSLSLNLVDPSLQHNTFGGTNLLLQIQADPKKFLLELQKLDPDVLQNVLLLLEELLESSETRESKLRSELTSAATNLNNADDAVLDAEEALETAEEAVTAAETDLKHKKKDRTGKKSAKTLAQANEDGELPGLENDQRVLRDVIAQIKSLIPTEGPTEGATELLTSAPTQSPTQAADQHYQDRNGYKLIGITNGFGSANPDIDMSARIDDPFVGEYVKPYYGTFSRLRYECGYSESGVLGYIELSGRWTWSQGGFLTANGPITKVEDNVVWDPKLPGWDGQSDAPWNNHVDGVHFPNFGINGFAQIDGRQWDNRYAFTCNPQSSAFGNGDGAWASGSGTKYVRLWLKPAG